MASVFTGVSKMTPVFTGRVHGPWTQILCTGDKSAPDLYLWYPVKCKCAALTLTPFLFLFHFHFPLVSDAVLFVCAMCNAAQMAHFWRFLASC